MIDGHKTSLFNGGQVYDNEKKVEAIKLHSTIMEKSQTNTENI